MARTTARPRSSEIHEQISTTTGALTRSLSRRAREGLDLRQAASLGPRLATLLFAGALHVPYLATARHHSRSHLDLHAIESAFFGVPPRPAPRACSRGTRATGT
jgi:hypothetical protein